jgi:hypothetical protein
MNRWVADDRAPRALIVGWVGVLLLATCVAPPFGSALRLPMASPAGDGGLASLHALVPAVPSHPAAPARAGVHPGRAPIPSTGVVDPLSDYSHEPAPMGIADFGVQGVGTAARPYRYSTDSFEGNAAIRSASVTVPSGGSTGALTAFELNAVLVLQRGGVNYSYWVQNGLHVNTTTREFTIGGAYVWNFSSPTARLTNGEVVGAVGSTLVSDTYYFIPGCGGFAGQCSTLTWPANLTGRINVTTIAGDPAVEYQYDLGPGWVTYDTVRFPHLANATIRGFTVDGFGPTPIASSLLYDAEWVWVGAGGGSSSRVQSADLDLSLAFWNGYNYQAVPSAWDFGTDTGETSSNVSLSAGAGAASVPHARVTGGAGSLGVLYNGSSVGYLAFYAPNPFNGTLRIDGASVPFVAGMANVTLLAGPHPVALENFSNASELVTVRGGATFELSFPFAGLIDFHEVGLPTGTIWGVIVAGDGGATGLPTIGVHVANGSHAVSYADVAGFVRNASAPLTVVAPDPQVIVVAFEPFTYPVPVVESGLPSGTAWWVNANGTRYSGTGSTIEVACPNGSTPFIVGAAYEYEATPSAGTLNVTGGSFAPVSVDFGYRPTFLVGTVRPADAVVEIGGAALVVTNGAFNDSVIPGVYTITASAAGYASWSRSVNATAGNATQVNVTLFPETIGNSTTPSGPPLDLVAIGVVGGVALALAVVGIVLLRRGRRAG